MRKALWGCAVIALALQAAHADVTLETFTELDMNISASGGGFAGGTIYENPAVPDYREVVMYGNGSGTTVTIDKNAGTFTITSAGTGGAGIDFGYQRINTGVNAYMSTAMNANWSQLTAIRIKNLNVTNLLNITTVLSTNNIVGGVQYGNNESVSTVIRLGAFSGDLDIPLSTLQALSAAANMADIDAFSLTLTLPGSGGTASMDAIELIGVAPVPEPATATLVGMGIGALLLRRRKV